MENNIIFQLLVVISTFLSFVLTSSHGNSSSSHSDNGHGGDGHGGDGHGHADGIIIFQANLHHVATPFAVTAWVLIASLAKIVFHHFEKLSATIPESCLLILLGIPVGYILEYSGITGGDESTILTSDLFFFYLLPPIILDAGYFMPTQTFYRNIGTILLYAVFGTIFNSFAVGLALWGVSGVADFKINLLQSLLFGSLVSAVDPVAVLAVFEEVQVHEILYMLVFGESVLNDAASVVLYRTFESLINGTVNLEQVALAFGSFFVVSLGGALIGLIFALLTSFITKYTEHVRVIEPVFIFLMAYMSYLTAEIFHFSGIISILFCGIIMKPYVESNMSRKSHTTVKYFLKLLSSSADSIIFMFLGASLVQFNHKFNITFIAFTLLFITVFRAIGVVFLTGLANKFGRLEKVKTVEQFIMSYGGLRGAVAFCLAILIQSNGTKESDEFKRTIVTTTITVVMFTTFIQGTTIKKLVDLLGVRKSVKRDKTMAEALNDRMLGYVMAGVEEIIGVHGHGFWSDILELINKKFLRKLLVGDPDNAYDDNLLAYQRKIAFKYALDYANNPSIIFARENDGETLSHIKSNPSVAMHLALKAQDEHYASEYCGVLDINALSNRTQSTDEEFHQSEAFNQRKITSLIPKAKRQHKRRFSQRKYTLNSLDEEDGLDEQIMLRRRGKMPPIAPHPSRPLKRPHHRHHHHHDKKSKSHKHKHSSGHRSKGRSQATELSTLSETDFDEVSSIGTSSTIELHPSYLKDSSLESDSEESGIVLHFGDKEDNPQGFMPSLPLYDDVSGPRLSQYRDEPIVDAKDSRELTERDEEELRQAKKWRSYTIASEGEEVIVNDEAVNNDTVNNDTILYMPESPTDSKETKF